MSEEPVEVKGIFTRSTWALSLLLSGLASFPNVIRSKEITTLVDQAVASAANFLTGVIIGRVCTKEEFGLYMLGFTVVFVLMNFQRSLILGAYSVFIPRLKGIELAKYAGSTLIYQLGFSLLTIVLITLGGILTSLGYGPKGLSVIMWTLAGMASFILLREYARQISFAHLDIKSALILDSSVGIIQVGGLLLLAYYGVLSASWAFWVIGAACGLIALIWFISRRRDFVFQVSSLGLDFKQNWAFSKWLIADRLVYLSANQLYPFILVYFYGTAATGVLAACSGVVYIANPLLIGMSNFLGPKSAHAFAQGGKKEVRQVVLKDSIIISAIMIPFCIMMLIFGDSILSFIYGAKYAGNGVVVGVLALSQLTLALTLPAASGLLAIERPEVGFTGSLLAFVSMLSLGLWFVKLFGPTGVGLGLLAGNLAISGYRWIMFNKECSSRFL